jgi:DNA-binding IclR family transcriptional regulator
MTDARPAYSAPALEKGLDILELMAAREAPMSLRALAAELGRSKSEIFRMVAVLLDRGYIVRDPVSDDLVLTNRLFDLGMRTPKVRDLVSEAVPVMKRLAEEVGHTPHLVVVHRGETVVIAFVPGGAEMTFSLKLGYHRRAVDATSGQVVIAFQPPDIQERMIAESLRLTPEPIAEPDLHAALARIRAQGHEVHDSRDFAGITDLCAPILDTAGHALACINVTYMNRLGRPARYEEVLAALKRHCAAIAAAMA